MILKAILKRKKSDDLMRNLVFIPPVHHSFYKSLKSCVCQNDSLNLVICGFYDNSCNTMFRYTDTHMNKAFKNMAFWGKIHVQNFV